MLRLFVAVPAASALRADSGPSAEIAAVKHLTIEQVVNQYFDAEEWTDDDARQDLIDMCDDIHNYFHNYSKTGTYTSKEKRCADIKKQVKDMSKSELKSKKKELQEAFNNKMFNELAHVQNIHERDFIETEKLKVMDSLYKASFQSLAANSMVVVRALREMEMEVPQSNQKNDISWWGGDYLTIFLKAIVAKETHHEMSSEDLKVAFRVVINFMEALRKKLPEKIDLINLNRIWKIFYNRPHHSDA